MKRVFALLLALLMFAGLLAGCGGNKEETTTSTAPTASTSALPTRDPSEVTVEPTEIELPLVDDTYTFSYWYPLSSSFEGFSGNDDNEFYQWVEEQTNVHIEWIAPASGSERESFQTMVLSNDYPDFVQNVKGYYTGGVDKAIIDEFVLPLNDYVDRWMPNYRAEVYRTDEIFTQCVSDSGNLWAVHQINKTPQCTWLGLGIRADWLDKAGLSTADVETMDGLEKVLAKFTEYTYEGQGPLYLSSGALNAGSGLNGAYNVSSVTYANSGMLNKDGVATYSPTEQGFKAYVGKMADWYAKGLVNKSFVADAAYSPAEARWANSDIGVGEFVYTTSNTLAVAASKSELMPSDSFKLTAITTPKVDASQDWATDVHVRQAFQIVRPNNSMCISTNCSDIELACHYWDYIWSDEGKTAGNWGPRLGEYGDADATYYIDESDANGDGMIESFQPHAATKYGNATNFMTKTIAFNSPTYTIFQRVWTTLSLEEINFTRTWEIAGGDWMWPESVTLTKDEGAHASSILAACNTAVTEWTIAVITGEKSVDTYETELMPMLESMNYADGVADYQAALDRYYARTQFIQG